LTKLPLSSPHRYAAQLESVGHQRLHASAHHGALSSPHRYAAQLESVGLVITLLFAFEMFLKLLGLG
jgi:hypothetical protein